MPKKTMNQGHCPKCNSENVDFSDINDVWNDTTHEMWFEQICECQECGCRFRERYSFKDQIVDEED